VPAVAVDPDGFLFLLGCSGLPLDSFLDEVAVDEEELVDPLEAEAEAEAVEEVALDWGLFAEGFLLPVAG
jgi:hypothetical protein